MEMFKIALLLLVLFALYMLPTIIAFHRQHPNRWFIGLVNFVFGCSVIGWLGSLIWACHAFLRSPEGDNGGETGLNIFINDTNKVERSQLNSDALDNIAKLKSLLDQGIINNDEFTKMKSKYIDAAMR